MHPLYPKHRILAEKVLYLSSSEVNKKYLNIYCFSESPVMSIKIKKNVLEDKQNTALFQNNNALRTKIVSITK